MPGRRLKINPTCLPPACLSACADGRQVARAGLHRQAQAGACAVTLSFVTDVASQSFRVAGAFLPVFCKWARGLEGKGENGRRKVEGKRAKWQEGERKAEVKKEGHKLSWPFERSQFRNPKSEIQILAYHKVDTIREFGITCISGNAFEKQIRFLAENGYQSISPECMVAAIQTRATLPKKPILITFDDGYENVYTHAYPIMKQYGYIATIFLLAGYIEQWNKWDVKLGWQRFKHISWKQIRMLSREGFSFGSHGINHLFLTRHDDTKTKDEIYTSKLILEELLEQPINVFAYPYGNYNARVVHWVRECGYIAAFSLNPYAPITSDNIYALPRVAIYRSDTMGSFKAKLGLKGKTRYHLECVKNVIINKCAYGNVLRVKSDE